MNGSLVRIAPLFAALVIAGCNAGGIGGVQQSGLASNALPAAEQHGRLPRTGKPACNGSRHGMMQCDVVILSDAQPDVPSGWGAPDIVSAYHLPSATNGAGQIVAIIDAYDNPNVASDLATYRSQYGLGTANFTKYNQVGETTDYPSPAEGWAAEIDLDVEMVSATCPNCTIYLIEANSNRASDLGAAAAEAVTLGAHIVTNSYSGTGSRKEFYDTPDVMYTASAGDYGYGEFADPADFGSVVAVGGTVLLHGSGKRGWRENVWVNSGAGCSAKSKPVWQNDPGCNGRTGDDVSAVASNVNLYDTYDEDGWVKVGGTSVSSPIIAGVFALAGNATMQQGGKTFWAARHHHERDLNQVRDGHDGTCNPNYLCTAGTKEFSTYSGPAGWGTPNGIGAF